MDDHENSDSSPKELFENFKNTSDKALANGVKNTDGITKDQFEGRNLERKDQKAQSRLESYKSFYKFLLKVSCICVFLLVVVFFILLGCWIWASFIDPEPTIKNLDKLESFLKLIWDYALVALATMFISNLGTSD